MTNQYSIEIHDYVSEKNYIQKLPNRIRKSYLDNRK